MGKIDYVIPNSESAPADFALVAAVSTALHGDINKPGFGINHKKETSFLNFLTSLYLLLFTNFRTQGFSRNPGDENRHSDRGDETNNINYPLESGICGLVGCADFGNVSG